MRRDGTEAIEEGSRDHPDGQGQSGQQSDADREADGDLDDSESQALPGDGVAQEGEQPRPPAARLRPADRHRTEMEPKPPGAQLALEPDRPPDDQQEGDENGDADPEDPDQAEGERQADRDQGQVEEGERDPGDAVDHRQVGAGVEGGTQECCHFGWNSGPNSGGSLWRKFGAPVTPASRAPNSATGQPPVNVTL